MATAFSYPETLDISRWSTDADRSSHYEASASVEHTGAGANRGHYIALLRPSATSRYIRFDDASVSSIAAETVVAGRLTSNKVAMLVYHRKPVHEEDVAATHEQCVSLICSALRQSIADNNDELTRSDNVARQEVEAKEAVWKSVTTPRFWRGVVSTKMARMLVADQRRASLAAD